jgi:hypothetical protein
MKNTNSQAPGQHSRSSKNRPPDVRDNLDSRKNEEQEIKGDDITHNRKAHQNKQQRLKNNNK